MKNKFKLFGVLTGVVSGLLIFLNPGKSYAVLCGNLTSLTASLSNTTCVISGVMGVDNPQNNELSLSNQGSISLSNTSITINAGSALVGGSITLGNNVSVSIATGGQLLPGKPLYVKDADGDGWPEDFTLFTATAAGRRRLGLMKSMSVSDCTDSAYDPTNFRGTFYADADGDGYGAAASSQTGCTQPAGYVADNTDCNDGSNLVHISHAQCYTDLDADTFTTGGSGKTCLNTSSCNTATQASATGNGQAVTAYAAGQLKDVASATTDCKDTGPFAANVMYSGLTCYYDGDHDGYGRNVTRTCFNTQSCATATYGTTGAADDAVNVFFATNASDCYDANGYAYPGSGYCGTSNRGDGSFDYNCDASPVKCGTIYNMSTAGCGTADTCPSCIGAAGNRHCGSTSQVGYYCGATSTCGGYFAICTLYSCTNESCSSNGTSCQKSGGTDKCTSIQGGYQGCN